MTENNKIELKPCPFCGKKPKIENWSSGGFMYIVKCNNPDCPVSANFIEMKQFFAIARNGTDGEEYTLQWLQSEVEDNEDD